jgi:UDP-N-acetylglucosamine--N-acetylmuramyl-(pentapeptide) pyrophosphoryl-undecaprenol N-acetylglucosamine transferase
VGGHDQLAVYSKLAGRRAAAADAECIVDERGPRMTKRQPCALIMAGGTGGHIFPGLAVAEALRERGWRVHWLGAPGSMESRLVPPRGFALETIDFGGVRGKGVKTLVLLPLRLLRAFWQALQVVRRVQPDVLVGLGGYITFPGGMMGTLLGKPLVLHEQNSVAGMANKVLAGIADRVFTAFPNVFKKAEWVGNPLRAEFLRQPAPAQRFAGRSGPLRLLVVGGSLGAKALNDTVPQALALIPSGQRPQVVHQSGEKQIDALRANYTAAGVLAELTPFIDDTAQAFADADLIVCRAGASTVTEIAAVGAAALLVPFPHAVDDHQTTNARFLTDAGGAWVVQQNELTPQMLASQLQSLQRNQLLAMAEKAKQMEKTHAVAAVVSACEQLAKVKTV